LANAVILNTDESIKCVITTGIDITERQQAEQKLQETTRLQNAILNSANYTIIATTVDGTILTLNSTA
jgi:PAS domain-containing protein